ncbi:MAG TPA: PaaI family thioesterase [Polyangium sp.]|nr:PaaI family thioesterase [Polyangium sp.]
MSVERKPSKITAEEFETAIRFGIPMMNTLSFRVECIEAGYARLRMQFDERHVRPGGTIPGPLLVVVADAALYAMVMSVLGMELLAVTSNLNIHFLRKPLPTAVIGEATMIRHGRRSIVGQVILYSDGESEPIAHVTSSYALP